MATKINKTKLKSNKFKATKPKRFDTVSAIIEYEGGNPTVKEMLELFSHLVKTGQVWSLQGMYGRQATALINTGLLKHNGDINYQKIKDEGIDTNQKIYGELQ